MPSVEGHLQTFSRLNDELDGLNPDQDLGEIVRTFREMLDELARAVEKLNKGRG